MKRLIAFLLLALVPVLALPIGARVTAQVATAADPPRYALPPQPIVDLFDAEFLRQPRFAPTGQMLAIPKARAYPTIAELSQPMLRLAGSRVNPKTNGPHRA